MQLETLAFFIVGMLAILGMFCRVVIYIICVYQDRQSASDLPAFLTIDELREDYETHNDVRLDDSGGDK